MKIQSTLFYIASILFYLAAFLGFVSRGDASMAVVWLGLGSAFLCLGAAAKTRENDNDKKEE